MPRPTAKNPANGLQVLLSPAEFDTLDALARRWHLTRTGTVRRMIREAYDSYTPFDEREQERMDIRSPHAPNVHVRYVHGPGVHRGAPLFLWCFDPSPENNFRVHPAEPSASGVPADLNVASLAIPKKTSRARAVEWAARAHYRPPGKW